MISNNHKNSVQNTRTKGISNTNQAYQHRLLRMDITLRLKNDPITDENKK